jgi:hypothetical protein
MKLECGPQFSVHMNTELCSREHSMCSLSPLPTSLKPQDIYIYVKSSSPLLIAKVPWHLYLVKPHSLMRCPFMSSLWTWKVVHVNPVNFHVWNLVLVPPHVLNDKYRYQMKGTNLKWKTAYVKHIQPSRHQFWIISRSNTLATVSVMRWYHRRCPKHCNHLQSVVHPQLSYNHSWFIHHEFSGNNQKTFDGEVGET